MLSSVENLSALGPTVALARRHPRHQARTGITRMVSLKNRNISITSVPDEYVLDGQALCELCQVA